MANLKIDFSNQPPNYSRNVTNQELPPTRVILTDDFEENGKIVPKYTYINSDDQEPSPYVVLQLRDRSKIKICGDQVFDLSETCEWFKNHEGKWISAISIKDGVIFYEPADIG